MKIAVNTRFLIKNQLEGIGVFTYETIKRITKAHPEHEFFLFFDRNPHKDFKFSENVKIVVLTPPARHPFLWYWWFEFSVHSKLYYLQADLFVSMDGYLSLRNNTPVLNVIHDIAFEHYPKDIPWLVSKYYRFFFPKFAQKATRIATVSEFSKNDICKQYQISADKIDVVYNGANEIFQPLENKEIKLCRNEISDSHPYFIYVGAMHQRKNIANLLKAFDIFKAQSNSKVKLVLTGRVAWKSSSMFEVYKNMTYKDDVIMTGRLDNKTLARYVASALAMTYVSYFEGFGIPVLEAMYCDVPSIISNITSLPEVGGNAALQVDPFNPEAIAFAMNQISANDQLRSELIQNGRIHRKKFSWDLTAAHLWDSMMKTIENKTR